MVEMGQREAPQNSLSTWRIPAEALQLIPEGLARRYNVIPLAMDGNTLRVAMADPTDIFALEALATRSKMRVESELATAKEIQDAIDFNYKGYKEIEKQVSGISQETEEEVRIDETTSAPVAQALNLIIEEAVKARASDIHLQPAEDRLRVRYRIDGVLYDMFFLPISTATPLISRIKVLANMNIADHHRPQDGQFSILAKGRPIDIRVGTTATVWGEMAALRLLNKSQATLTLTELGFSPEGLAKYEKMLKVSHGMILISGPTGSGKTTTLYASVNRLDHIGQNIITIEDPVEYRFEDINQIQVNPRAGLTFASGLRSILRLDPNIILVGEIRDAETASVAIQAALTGHLVLSSIHANDAIGVVLRFLNLGVEPFLIVSALTGVVAQRMVRCICPYCVEKVLALQAERAIYFREVGEEREQFLYGHGCPSCANTGYRGRTGIFEILPMSEKIKALLLKGAADHVLREEAIKEGMVSLVTDGMLRVKAGITTPSEVLRTTYTV